MATRYKILSTRELKTDLTDNSDDFIASQKAVKTALDTKAPTASPTFTGTVETPAIKITTGAGLGKVLTSDADGDATWETAGAVPVKATGAELDTGTDDAKFATAKAIADSKLSYTDGSETLTNKRINPRLVTATSYTTDTGTSLTVANCDQFEITAQAGALKFNNPGGTPVGGQKLIIRIKDNGTARALTYDTQFRAIGVTLPATTIASKTLYMGFIWNNTDSKWDCVAISQEA